MVKQTKVWKIDFFKNSDENGGAMNEAIKQCKSEQIVIHSQTQKNGRMWGCVEPSKFLKLMETNCGLYEVITQFPHKVYFDIDRAGTSVLEYLEEVKQTINQFFPNAEMAISGSIKETKTSYHIILQNYVIHDETERQYMKCIVRHISNHIDGNFDWKVYTKNRNMKIINQSKDDGRVQEIIENQDFKAHCITCFVANYALPFLELPPAIQEEIMVDKSHQTFDIGSLPKMVLTTPTNFDFSASTADELLNLLPLNKSFDHNYTHLVARFCYYNKISFETFLSWIQQKHNPLRPDIIKKWQGHFTNMEKFPEVSKDKILSVLKAFYPHINKDIHFRNFSQTFILPTEKIQKIETINQTLFHSNHKYKIFNVGMGGGKTAQTISYLKTEANFLWIAPNKALASNTHKRFENENIEVCHYETINSKEKKEGKMKDQDKLIVCLNSIHYITDRKYDVLIIDEIETLVDKFLGDFLEQGKLQLKLQIWKNFISLFRNAKSVVLLDAFITTKTIKLIQSIEGELNNIIIYERIQEPQTRTIKYMNDDKTMLQDIIDKIKQGSKLFIFYPYKNSGLFNSMEQIYSLLCAETGKKGIFYNADVDDKVKAGLKDVNGSWGECDFIITNNIITCGVNYENLDFDYKYIFIGSHNTPRDVIQVSYRARHLNSGLIKICYLGKMNSSNTWLNDCKKINCPIYDEMYKEILIEKKAPLRRAFQLFCVKAHYKQTTDEFKINESVSNELTEMLNNQNVGMWYENIDDIDFSQAEEIERLCFAQQATMMDKFAINKYYFKNSFLQEHQKDDLLAVIWNDRYTGVFKRLGNILTNQNHLFNEIATFNNLPHLFPVEVKKMKLSPELKAKIFTEFSFKYITSSSTTTKIIMEIYNTYFSKHIIKAYYTATSKAPIYGVDKDVYDYYEFAKQNMVLDSHTYMTYKQLQAVNESLIEI